MPHNILIINPNSNAAMTDSLRAPIEAMGYHDTNYTFFTGPPSSPSSSSSCPKSINNLTHARESTTACLPLLLPLLLQHLQQNEKQKGKQKQAAVGVVVACYSPHPLVRAIANYSDGGGEEEEDGSRRRRRKGGVLLVTGIFEASVWTAVGLLLCCGPPPAAAAAAAAAAGAGEGGGGGGKNKREKEKKFGIVSTGAQWAGILTDAVAEVLGAEGRERWFAGVECVGLDAGGLAHGEEEEEEQEEGSVKARIQAATRRLVERGDDIGVVVLGCAGMVGMEAWVREVVGEGVAVVDGVKAGVGVVQGWLRGGFLGEGSSVEREEEEEVGGLEDVGELGKGEDVMRMQVGGGRDEAYERQLSGLAEEQERRVELGKRQRME